MVVAQGIGYDLEKQRPGQGHHLTTQGQPWKTEIWMSSLADECALCDLSIPGTHDSAAYTYAVPFIATQNLDIQEQLSAGIRFFDLRCGLQNNVLQMVHGPQFLGLTLQDLLTTVYGWLDEHQSEALIMQLKKDRMDESSSISFSEAVVSLLAENDKYWRIDNTTPTLGELRGRIQLLRRFRGDDLTAYGLNVSRWQDNPKKPFTMNVGHGIKVSVQDHYRYDDPLALPSLVKQKCSEIAVLLSRAGQAGTGDHWYLNFTSAYEFNWGHRYSPREIAQGGWHRFKRVTGVNHALLEYIHDLDDCMKLGIVAMDYPDLTPGLIDALISTNFDAPAESISSHKLSTKGRFMIMLLCIVCLLLLTLAPIHIR